MTGGAATVPTSVARSWLSLTTTMEDGPSSILSSLASLYAMSSRSGSFAGMPVPMPTAKAWSMSLAFRKFSQSSTVPLALRLCEAGFGLPSEMK